MGIYVKMMDIVNDLDMQFDGYSSFLNSKTGEVISVSDDDLRAAEEIDSIDKLPEWKQKDFKTAIDVVENYEDYIALPNQYEINEYDMVEEFCLNIQDEDTRVKLLRTIRGKGAFRRFKDNISSFGIEDEWYAYRNECYKQLAKEWCIDNKISFIEES
ncbi:UPF0158 family protein [Pseudalkalibacillus decolorationis]|uniref:UPF0158 family protein n=1 Tax=Pseudalkalibacillus decolorationis TaxID=163879 RepID=UPI002147C22E|nr:UPF0158 family protein [Pseudalkalibacillus decolorationis]